jgi:hypothetical protein
MAKGSATSDRKTVVKRTSQGGNKPKTSAMNKVLRRSFKAYRGQGK